MFLTPLLGCFSVTRREHWTEFPAQVMGLEIYIVAGQPDNRFYMTLKAKDQNQKIANAIS